jgi:FtsP/CotA-like multicopper oxidase with cupredoxin domain
MNKDRKNLDSMTRRKFVGTTAASFGALATIGMPGLRQGWSPGHQMAAPTGGGKTVVRYPLHIPPAVDTPSNFALQAAPSVVDLGDGRQASALAYNSLFPGPTFRADSGDPRGVSVSLGNGLSQETTVHWHGMVVPTAADGHPMDAVAPGGSLLYQYAINQRAALNWYHPHPHMLTGEQVALGLAGAFIVNDAEETLLGLPSGNHEVPLIVRDASLDRKGNLRYHSRTTGFLGDLPFVNGTRDPYLDVDTALYRFRVLNGANSRVFRLALGNGDQFHLIGNDGGLLPTAVTIGQIEFGNGERLDLLVDFRGLPVGTKVMLRDLNSGWNLLEFRVARLVTDTTTAPTTLSTIVPLSNPVRTRVFNFDGMSRINGLEFEMNRIDFQVPFGQTERWIFKTGGNAPHPVHVHGASFQVQSRSGGRGVTFPWEQGWKDTVLLLDQETVDVLIRFEGYRGIYLLHCHKLEHEDMGMMSNFQVV